VKTEIYIVFIKRLIILWRIQNIREIGPLVSFLNLKRYKAIFTVISKIIH